MRRCLNTPRAMTTPWTIAWLPTTFALPSRTRKCSREQKLLSPAELDAIRAALTAIGEEHAQGKWRISLDQEDCQTAIENLLTARIGATGGRLHAGRSRNDQVLAALRLYMRDAAEALAQGALAVAEALRALARATAI